MPPKCFYINCKNISKEVSMFRFPTRDPRRLDIWLNKCGNTTLTHLSIMELRNRYLCIKHFDSKFIKNGTGQRKRLSRLAIPEHYTEDEPHSPSSSTSQGNTDLETLTNAELSRCVVCQKHFEKHSIRNGKNERLLIGSADPLPYNHQFKNKALNSTSTQQEKETDARSTDVNSNLSNATTAKDPESNAPKTEERKLAQIRHEELDNFFLSMSKICKEFSPYMRAVVKSKIFSVVSEIELQEFAPSSELHTSQIKTESVEMPDIKQESLEITPTFIS